MSRTGLSPGFGSEPANGRDDWGCTKSQPYNLSRQIACEGNGIMVRSVIFIAVLVLPLLAGCADSGNTVDSALCAPADSSTIMAAPEVRRTFDAANTGEQAGPGLEGEPSELWSLNVGKYYSRPSMVDDILYMSYGNTMGSRHLFALNPYMGSEIWRLRLDKNDTAPSFAGSRTFVAHQDGNLYALDSDDGEEIWRFQMGADPAVTPIVVKDLVLVVSGLSGNTSSVVSAIKIESGDLAWRYELPDSLGFTDSVMARGAAVGDGGVYIGTFSGTVYGLDLATGERCWDIAPRSGSPIFVPPALANGTLYFVTKKMAFAVDAHTGEAKWEAKNISAISSLAVSSGMVYVGTEDGSLTALGARSGEEKWTLEVGDFRQTEPAVVDGVVYAASDDGYLYAVDATTGRQRWRYKVGEVHVRPTIANGIVYVVADGRLIAITDS